MWASLPHQSCRSVPQKSQQLSKEKKSNTQATAAVGGEEVFVGLNWISVAEHWPPVHETLGSTEVLKKKGGWERAGKPAQEIKPWHASVRKSVDPAPT